MMFLVVILTVPFFNYIIVVFYSFLECLQDLILPNFFNIKKIDINI